MAGECPRTPAGDRTGGGAGRNGFHRAGRSPAAGARRVHRSPVAVAGAWRFPPLVGHALCPARVRALRAKQTDRVSGSRHQLPHAPRIPAAPGTATRSGPASDGLRRAGCLMGGIDERALCAKAHRRGLMTQLLYLCQFFMVVPPMPLLMLGAFMVATVG